MFSKDALVALEALLIREKASALSDRQAVERLYGAYGEKRDAIDTRRSIAVDRYQVADSLLTLVREELNGVR